MEKPAKRPQNIHDGLVRLQRHEAINRQGYDRAALLDMAHTLRTWADMKKEANDYLTEGPFKFCGYRIGDKLKQFLRDKTYFAAFFYPKGVQTRVVNISHLVAIFPPNKEKVDHIALLKDVYKQTYDFAGWMDSEVIRFSYVDVDDGKIKMHKLSRENFIRRLANAYGASHPTGYQPREKTMDDHVIDFLFQQDWGELPAPYCIALHIAQQILDPEVDPKWEKKRASE